MDIQQKSASRYLITVLAFLLILTAFLLVALNAMQLQNLFSTKPKATAEQGYIKGYLAARGVYRSLCPILSQTSKQLTGIVRENNGSVLKVLQRSLDTDSLVDDVGNLRTITIDAQTKIQQSAKKTPEQIAREFEALAQNKQKTSAQLPQPLTFSDIPLSAIQPGVTVYIESAQDLRLLATIPATVIRILNEQP